MLPEAAPIPRDLPPGTQGTHDGLRWVYYGDTINVQQRIPWDQVRGPRTARRVGLRDPAQVRDSDGTEVESHWGIVQSAGRDRRGLIVGDAGWLHNNPGEMRGGAASHGDRARERFAGALGVGAGNSVVFRSPAEGREAVRQAIRSSVGEALVHRMCRWDDPQGQCNPWDLDPTIPPPHGVTRRRPAYVEPARHLLDRHHLSRETSCDTLPPAVLDEMVDFIARNETPGHGHIYSRNDPDLPPWVRTIFERSSPAT